MMPAEGEEPDELRGRLDALEARVAHQDATIEDLDATVSAQWRKIDALVSEILQLTERLQDVAGRDPRSPEPPPPHY